MFDRVVREGVFEKEVLGWDVYDKKEFGRWKLVREFFM